MSMPDYYYYQAVAKHRSAELQARSQQEHLVKVARESAKRQRAASREARRLQDAVDGRQHGLLAAVRTLFSPAVAGAGDQATAVPQADEATQVNSTPEPAADTTAARS